MACNNFLEFFFLTSLLSICVESGGISRDETNLQTSFLNLNDESNICVPNNDSSGHHARKDWAILVAGSRHYSNYRHQADICHAYQILKNDGLKDENIIVFMYDDIALSENNPRPGIIINHPHGKDVYKGVPKDYIKDDANVKNFFGVLLGNKSAIKGGSGKIVDSGPNDNIFIYYADHGASGLVEFPSGEDMFADEFVDVLKKKHAAKSFKNMVIYLEACESGSMFEGLLPNNLNIYAITASNRSESSWATYCFNKLNTCLGDLFSVSWLEDSDKHDPRKETLEQQYEVVKKRTGTDGEYGTSHVMQYGDMKLRNHYLSNYMGGKRKNRSLTADINLLTSNLNSSMADQYDADLFHFKSKYDEAPEGSQEKLEAKKNLLSEMSCREHVQESINQIEKFLLDDKDGPIILNSARPQGKPVVDDWARFKMLVKTYEEHCGSLSGYGKKYVRAIANMCNNGVQVDEMAKASIKACHARPRNPCKTIWNKDN